ncbi:hypothetical protein GNI_045200 [Gregarina niphandrodes]|uniref:Uncharacterized protein n=1 Tax=Gregarina niphandrodes TaxID=110365 RepID=A0A023B9U5_GRENI|nr:hypothetical protein GNI_045200 [Gregarina niphandrodes]EZG76299.1 hypothetical protein GNI_045200 [Gregarina niphandrodes]|eukprot:XP_011129580.1 hypothetical protein GNI_045200 [Gregarina niphandrodes]
MKLHIDRKSASESHVLGPAMLGRFVVPVIFNKHLLDLCCVHDWLDRPRWRSDDLYEFEHEMYVLSDLGSELKYANTGYCVVLGGQVIDAPDSDPSEQDDDHPSRQDNDYPSWQDDFIKLLYKSPTVRSCLATVITDLAKRAEKMVGGPLRYRQVRDVLAAINRYRYDDRDIEFDCAREISFDRWDECRGNLTELAASYNCFHVVEEDGATVQFPASHLTCRPSKLLGEAAKKMVAGLTR